MGLIINGEIIDDALLEQEFAAIKSHFESLGNVSCCERDGEFRGYARDNIIARVLLAQEAERAIDPVPDQEIDAAVEKLKAEHGGDDRFAAATGFTADQSPALRDNVHTELRMRKLVERLSAGDPEPSESDLRAFYEGRIDQFKTVEEVRATHILKAPRRGEDREGAYEQLREARERILGGADFHEVARACSDKPESETDLGYFKRGELMEEFERVAFSMRIGEISPIFASPFGFHLVKLTDRRPPAPKPFEEVRDTVRERFLADRREGHIRRLLEELKARAAIEEPAAAGTP